MFNHSDAIRDLRLAERISKWWIVIPIENPDEIYQRDDKPLDPDFLKKVYSFRPCEWEEFDVIDLLSGCGLYSGMSCVRALELWNENRYSRAIIGSYKTNQGRYAKVLVNTAPNRGEYGRDTIAEYIRNGLKAKDVSEN